MTLGILVQNFGSFVRERHDPPAAMDTAPAPAFSEDLAGLHRDYAHHIIPLSLLARSDGDAAQAEQNVIVEHCVTLARLAGKPASDSERGALARYIGKFRPTLMQLTPALHRLEHEPHEQVDALLLAAKAVIEADGVVKPDETRFLDSLRQEFANPAQG